MSVSAAEEAEDPACIPIFWVSKWVDYSDKYGLGRCLPGRWGAQVRLRAPASCYGLWPFLAPRFSALNTLLSPSQLPVLPPCSPLPLSEVSLHLPLGYQLCDNSVGVLFNDSTRLILYNDGDSLQYIERDGTESYLTVSSHPNSLIKKITLLKYFRNYMSEHLLKAGANITPREGDELARLPYLRTWFRTRSAIILHLSNGCVQINFFQVGPGELGWRGVLPPSSGGPPRARRGVGGLGPVLGGQQEKGVQGGGVRTPSGSPHLLGYLPSPGPQHPRAAGILDRP